MRGLITKHLKLISVWKWHRGKSRGITDDLILTKITRPVKIIENFSPVHT